MRKIENFFRAEGWLHLATMFFLMVMFIQVFLLMGIYLPTWFLLIVPIFIGVTWEILWNKIRGNPIDITDVAYTVIGGYLAILILRI